MARRKNCTFFLEVTRVLLGEESQLEGVGSQKEGIVTIHTDGSIAPLDVFNIIPNYPRPKLDIFNHDIDEIKEDSAWVDYHISSGKTPKDCISCCFFSTCAGGYIPHRYSEEKKFNNRSAHCNNLYSLYSKVNNTLLSQVDFG